MADTSSLRGIERASGSSTPAPRPAPAPAPTSNGSKRGISGEDSGSSTTPTPTNSAAGVPFRPGVYAPRPMSDVYVDTSSLRGIMGASDIGSATYNRLYLAGAPGRSSQIPSWSSDGIKPYHALFDAIAADYHPNSKGKKWYEQFVKDAIDISNNEGRYVNPVDLAYQYALDKGIVTADGLNFPPPPGGSGSWAGGGGFGGGSSTQMTIDLTSPQQARGLLMQTIQGVLGRNPTDVEYDDFVKILNETQTANPQVVSAVGDTVTRSGGVDAGLVALDYAQSQDDYQDRQATGFYNMFLDALAGG
jgi:hypothetical protein